MLKIKPNRKIRNIILAVLPALFVAVFWGFATPIQRAEFTVPVENGLVGYWNMDSNDIYSSTLYDKSGYGNHGTIYGATTTTGKIGEALSFNGTDDYVNAGDALSSYIADEITYEAWIYPYLIPSSGHDYIINWYHTVSLTTSYQVCVGCGVFFCKINGTSYSVYGKNVIPENQWMHIVGTRKGNTLRLYKNGVLESENTDVATGTIDAGTTLYIGQYPSSGYQFNGLIDEVRIYNRALSAEEVLQNYEASKRTYIDTSLKDRWTDGLVGYWTFDGPDIQGLNATATDVSGNENHGTIHGAQPAPGKIGQALSFNGENDYVEVQNHPSLNPASAITVSAWAKPSTAGQSQKPVVLKSFTSHTTPHYQYYIFWINTGSFLNRYSFGVTIDGTNRNSGSYIDTTLPGRWAHVVGTYDGSRVRLFVDGVERSVSDEYVGSISSYDTELHFGRYRNLALSSAYVFNGLIDEVRIYNRALSISEIQEHYQGGMRRMEIQQ